MRIRARSAFMPYAVCHAARMPRGYALMRAFSSPCHFMPLRAPLSIIATITDRRDDAPTRSVYAFARTADGVAARRERVAIYTDASTYR